ncbi:outer membrane beta-barrel family protein [Maribellus sediminis]|uniref:outer membrane beta-barrel family protein n=1 Tax=Maribellus sediminis TaxID=2696285 RepID=UPI0014320CE6|nr:outer membrane beta-barrel family protein [Maribellus sediminis]
MKKIVLWLLIFNFSAVLASKANVEKTGPESDDGKGKIKGVIIDKASSTPMEFANIAIYDSGDSTLITGGITNSNGEFEIGDVTYGAYYLQANFIGFDPLYINDIVLNRENKIEDLGEIDLSVSTVALGEVNVVADRAAVEYKLDKKVVNVSQVISAAGGTAVEVLENTPSVQVDIDGNVSLRGSSNFTVLIDGRPSVLTGSDALQQIPASAIENIEIITNPSAKYEPDGTTGIINLVMKKNSMNGLSGIINASVGTRDKYRGDFTLSYRTEKFNITAGADFQDENGKGGSYSRSETYAGDSIDYLNMDGTRLDNRKGHNFKAGVDWFVSDNTTFGIQGRAGSRERFNTGGGKTHAFTNYGGPEEFSISEETSTRSNDFYSGTMSFQHKFNGEGHQLDAMAFYSRDKGDDEEVEGEIWSDADYEYDVNNPVYAERVSTVEGENEHDFRFQVDYVYPFSKDGKLEAGMMSRIEKEEESLDFRDYDQASDTWIPNDQYSSLTDFRRDIHAVYTTFSNKLGNFSYMAGLRGEYTLRKIDNTNADGTSELNRFDLFPTAHISYPLGENNEFMASFSRRINRPGGWDLDPSPNYFNRYTIRFGNPDLKPEYTNSYELGYMRRFGRSYVSLDAFHRVTNNKIDRYSVLGEDDVYYLYTDNFDKDYATGLELTGNVNFTKWLIVNASTSMYHYRITGTLEGESIDRTSTNWSGRINTTFRFSDNSRMQIQGFYNGPSVSAQGERKAMIFSNISYRHDFMKKKLTATVSVRDPFGTASYQGESYGENFSRSYKWEREPRVVMLTLSYKLNNFKEDRNGNRGEGGGMDMDGGGEF